MDNKLLGKNRIQEFPNIFIWFILKNITNK